MKRLDPLVAEICKKHSINMREAIWDCHGTPVMYHRFIERVATAEGITYDPPVIIDNNPSQGMVTCLVTGRHPDGRVEWSFGEVSPKNNKNAYPYAMAEKRAKDRVVLKLAGLAGFVYSDVDVADEHAATSDTAWEVAEPDHDPAGAWREQYVAAMLATTTQAEFDALKNERINVRNFFALPPDEQSKLVTIFKQHMATLTTANAA